MLGLQRSQEQRVLLGVCSGIARAAGTSPTLFRLAFVVAGLASGVGVLVYVVLAFVMDPPGMRGATVGERVRGNLLSLRQLGTGTALAIERWRTQPAAAVDPAESTRAWFGLGALVLGLVVLLWSFGLFWWLDFWRTLGLVALLAGVGVLLPRGTAKPSALRASGLVIGIGLTALILTAGAGIEIARIATVDAAADSDSLLDEQAEAELTRLRIERAEAEARIRELERRVDMLEALPGLVAVLGQRGAPAATAADTPTRPWKTLAPKE